jgi:hypothetical protein
MRVKICEGNFEGQCGEAANDMKTWAYWVRLDILPDYPMQFAGREFIPLAPSDAGKQT